MRKFKNVSICGNSKGSVNVGPSMTVPDESMTPQELLLRFTQGKPIPNFQAVYSDDDLPDLSSMDLVEIQQLKDQLKSDINELQEEISRRKNDEPNDDQKSAITQVVPD